MEPDVAWSLVLMVMVTPSTAIWGNLEGQYIKGYERAGTFVHLQEWSYKDILNECASLDWNGYYGIIISPPVEHVEIRDNHPGWKERYMPISFTRFTTRSGTEEELQEMMRRCYNWNMFRVIVDINLNNMLKGTDGAVVGFAGTPANPSKYEYDDGIGRNQFNEPCPLESPEDWQNEDKVRICQVHGMQDLDIGNVDLNKKIVTMMNRLVKMNVFGFRIHLARHMYPDQLYRTFIQLDKIFNKKDKPLIIYDINDLDNCVVKTDAYKHAGMWTDYKYSNEIYKYFTSKADRDLNKLLTWDGVKVNGEIRPRGSEPLVFLQTHETQYQSEGVLKPIHGKYYRMGMAFLMAFPYGMPMVLSSYLGKSVRMDSRGKTASPRPDSVRPSAYYYECVNNFNCDHRLDTTIIMTIFKAEVKEQKLTYLKKDDNENWFAFARGDRGFIYFNAGRTSVKRRFDRIPLKSGQYCDLASGEIVAYGTKCTGKIITVERDGSVTIDLPADDQYGYVAIMTRMWLDPKKTAVAAVVNYNFVTKIFFGLPGKVVAAVVNTAMEAGEKMTETYHNPDAHMTGVVGAGAGAVGSKVFNTIVDLIEELGRRLFHKLQNMVMGAAETVIKNEMQKQVDGAVSTLNAALADQEATMTAAMEEALKKQGEAQPGVETDPGHGQT